MLVQSGSYYGNKLRTSVSYSLVLIFNVYTNCRQESDCVRLVRVLYTIKYLLVSVNTSDPGYGPVCTLSAVH